MYYLTEVLAARKIRDIITYIKQILISSEPTKPSGCESY